MKHSLLLFLLLPLHSFAQSGPRNYTLQNQQSRDYFNRSTNQRTMEFQQRQMQKHSYGRSTPQMTEEARLKAQVKQQQLEQEATEKLALLTQEQQRQRQEHPAKDPQLAAAQQKADDKQLNLLAVKNYREVFLQGQVFNARETQKLSPTAQQGLHNLNENLLNDAWWSKQEAAQLPGKIKAYNDTLTSLTAGLLAFAPATPAPLPASSLDDMLAKDAFDQNAANQLIREAALTERLMAKEQLAKAVQDFNTLSTAAASNPALQSDPKELRKGIQKSLRTVNKELSQYDVRIASSSKVYLAEKALRKSTSAYLAKNSK